MLLRKTLTREDAHPEIEGLLKQAVKFKERGAYVEALLTYDRIIQLDPKNSDAFINKGFILLLLRRFEEALAICDQALQLDPSDSRAFFGKGTALNGLGRYTDRKSVV